MASTVAGKYSGHFRLSIAMYTATTEQRFGLGSDETVDQQSGSGSTHEANSAAHSTDYDTLLTTGGSTTAGQLIRTKEGDGGDDDMQLSSCRSPSTDSDLCAPYAAKFLLQLREGRQISQVAVSDVIDGFM